MAKPIGLVQGHYECRFFDETLPIFTDILAMEIVERNDGKAILKHPNTGWQLVVHEGGVDASNKPHQNHYGFRVGSHKEVEAAYEFINANKDKYKIKSVSKPHSAHFAYSIYFSEPGGNDLEVEYYNPNAAKHGRKIAAQPWIMPLAEERFPGKGYIPQAMTHGTLMCEDKDASDHFYQEVLGLDIVGGGQMSTYLNHSSGPWYIVVLPTKNRKLLSPTNRFTLRLSSTIEVEEMHRQFSSTGKEIGITEVGAVEQENGEYSFMFSDLDSNWWEFTAKIGS